MAEFHVYRDQQNQFRWRLKANNNKTTADSGEGYVSKSNAIEAAKRVRSEVASARIIDDETGQQVT